MGFFDVCMGFQTYSDYISNQEIIQGFEKALAKTGKAQVGLTPNDYKIALLSGLGALGENITRGMDALQNTIGLGFEQLTDGIDKLNADFNFLMGEMIWKQEIQNKTLVSILQTLQAPLDTVSKELRRRAEYAYQNGWYEEALNDFLESEHKNYQDFMVHRSIANIYLYHIIDLTKAYEYFFKAAKYAKPRDARQAAEAHYFAGITCGFQQKFEEAMKHMREATELNPKFYDAYYMHASFAGILDDATTAIASLTKAIKGDLRYYKRFKTDKMFNKVRQILFENLLKNIQRKFLIIKNHVEKIVNEFASDEIYKRVINELGILDQIFYVKQIIETVTPKTFEEYSESISKLPNLFSFSEKYTLRGHPNVSEPVIKGIKVSFSPDSRIIASVSCYGTRKIWNVETGKLIRTLTEPTSDKEYVISASFSPDGKLLATESNTESNRDIKLWEVETGREIRTLKGHASSVFRVRVSPDGRILSSAGYDGIKLWEMATGKVIRTLSGHTSTVFSIDFSPDGKILASGSRDNTIKFWEVETGREIKTLRRGTPDSGWVEMVRFSPDGKVLALGHHDKQNGDTIVFWEVETGREINKLKETIVNDFSISFSPDGRLFATGTYDGTIKIWNLELGREIMELRGHTGPVSSVSFSPDGKILASGSGYDNTIKLWVRGKEEIEEALKEIIDQMRIAKERSF